MIKRPRLRFFANACVSSLTLWANIVAGGASETFKRFFSHFIVNEPSLLNVELIGGFVDRFGTEAELSVVLLVQSQIA